jgi:predicted nucleotidyltransferase
VKDELCPDIWEGQGESAKLKPNVRKKLLQIAELFREFVGVNFFVDDIVLMGSLVNYNWSKFSDADLHIIVDFSEFDQDKLDVYQELFGCYSLILRSYIIIEVMCHY